MKIFIYLILYAISLFAYDSIEILNPNIKIEKSGYFIATDEISADEAYKKFQGGIFTPLPQNAKSFGFSTKDYWYGFEISETTKQHHHFFLDLKDIISEHVTLFVFQNDKLVRSEISGYVVPIEQRPVKTFPIRFELENSTINTVYLLKINSQHPRYSAFAFGSTTETEHSWTIQHFIYVFACGVFFALVLYNAFLYFSTQDITYFWYCIYMTGLFAIISVAQGYTSLISYFFAQNSAIMIALCLQIELIGLTLFTEYFLHLREQNQQLSKILRYLLYINIGAAFLVPFGHNIQAISIIVMLFLFSVLLYAGIKSFLNGNKVAIYYLLSTGIAIGALCIFALMHQGIGLSFGLLSSNLMTAALIWDMILLSFALAYRIKLLQKEKEDAQHLIAQKAKFTTIGETIGNIAHQWRQPLNEIAAVCVNIETEVRFKGSISNEKLLDRINILDTILARLTKTVDTFQNFFNKNQTDIFNLTDCINATLQFMQTSLEQNNIVINTTIEKCDIQIYGNEDELFEALVIILNNAKDAMISNNTQNPYINFTLTVEHHNVLISIQDNGGGIKSKKIDKIFEPYYSTKGINGMGIGLYTAQIVINKMQGRIIVENTKNGASFTIVLKQAKSI